VRLLGAVSGIGVEALYLGHQAHAVLAARQLDKRFAHHLRLLSTGRGKCPERALSFIVETDRYRLFHDEQCITNVILERESGFVVPGTNRGVEFVYRFGEPNPPKERRRPRPDP
jgi:hypothetical protein